MIRLKRRTLQRSFRVKEVSNTYIQPFKEMPSVNTTDVNGPDRIDAHELFSLYTADIIKEDVIFFR